MGALFAMAKAETDGAVLIIYADNPFTASRLGAEDVQKALLRLCSGYGIERITVRKNAAPGGAPALPIDEL